MYLYQNKIARAGSGLEAANDIDGERTQSGLLPSLTASSSSAASKRTAADMAGVSVEDEVIEVALRKARFTLLLKDGGSSVSTMRLYGPSDVPSSENVSLSLPQR